MKNNEFKIFSFYQFKKIFKPIKLKGFLKEFCQFNKLKGTILIAPEGINGTIGGLDSSIINLEKELVNLGFTSLEKKYSGSSFMPFYRLKIRHKKEIITFTKQILNVGKKTGNFVNSKDWNKIIGDKNYYVIDLRNDYESKIGTFKNAIKVNTKNFTDYKKYIKNNLLQMKNNKIAMFCTGGIRCEKASSYMIKLGFKNLFQLKGGILRYLETVPSKQSKWVGECFLFDNRVSVKNGMKMGTYDLCYGCRMPISKKDKLSAKYEYGVSCKYCFDSLSLEKKENFRQRNKQIDLAKKKGLYSPYIRFTPSDY